MRISSDRAVVANKSDTTKTNTTSANFADKVRGNSAAQVKALHESVPISREELLALATEVKNKSINGKEANERFVKTVVENSLKGKLGEEDRSKMIQDIEQFCADDPEFVNNLIKNLSSLA